MGAHKEKLPYPKSVFFIVSNEFCERFSYYGMRTILTLYLVNILLFEPNDAKIIYHTFTCFVYFFPVFGAILSDSYLGKFKTIFYVSIIYAIGSVLLALASTKPLHIPQIPISMLGLALIAVGTGGIKPCVSAFGGDQFILPQQQKQLSTYFSLFYFSINSGSLISTFLTPVLREKVKCFDEDSCYPVAFAVPGGLMILSIIIFALGRPLYKVKKPEGNIIVKVISCITYAIRNRSKAEKKDKDHWLDHAGDKYDSKLIEEIKILLKVLVLFTPLPIFWALYDQQGSGWTLQAVGMDGDIGFYTILPDQMQVINPLLILLFIPFFTYVVYPLLAKMNVLTKPLSRMVTGGLLAALAFAVSAIISLKLEATYPVLPSSGNIQLRIYNPTNDVMTVSVPQLFKESFEVKPMEVYQKIDIDFDNTQTVKFTVNSDKTLDATLSEGIAYGLYLHETGLRYFEDDVAKTEDGNPQLRAISFSGDVVVKNGDSKLKFPDREDFLNKTDIGTYTVEGIENFSFKLKLGGTYTVLVGPNEAKLLEITEHNSVHILLQLPQYFIITAAEILYTITGYEFSYSQAPVQMKAVLQAAFLLTTAFGNLIIVIIESAKIFDKQSYDYFLYAGLMVLDMLLFFFLARNYKYVEISNDSTAEIEAESSSGLDNPTYEPENKPKKSS